MERKGRLANVRLRREDGGGQDYVHPSATSSPYLRLPFDYWNNGYYGSLSLPGKALLLIALTLQDDFSLPPERGPAWYGISPSTVERGLRELRRADLLNARRVRKSAPLAPEGYTFVNLYTLAAPFGPKRTTSLAVSPEKAP
jgi:DNA-binding transcriptional ArsR family regulator